MEDQRENHQCGGARQQAAGVPARHDLRRSFGGAALIGFVRGAGMTSEGVTMGRLSGEGNRRRR
ncbi:hypothetical protein MBT84_08615 [Streptomyces sp. MBT84]|nr:hypothetical protein [Streptomyces sp. MBT84]